MVGTAIPSSDVIVGTPKRNRPVGIVLFGLVAVSILLLLFVMPIPHRFSITESASEDLYQCEGRTTISIPSGDEVTFDWSTPSNVSFGVWNCTAGYVFLEQNGTNGAGSFVSTGGAYGFTSLCGGYFPSCPPANVTGTYSGPLLKF